MTTRAQLVAEARTWCGVAVVHQGRTRAGGVDCLGLVMAVGQASGAVGPIAEPEYYGRLPNSRRLVASLGAHLLELAQSPAAVLATVDDGDVVGLSWGKALHPMHLAIAATYDGRRTIIHADPRQRRVVEVTFAGVWTARACGLWRWPNLSEGV
jgi:cell wall-associated NlpC family hydrolase